jgi:2-hydroxyacyl-CoA lyase 1
MFNCFVVSAVLNQLNAALASKPWSFPLTTSPWGRALAANITTNKTNTERLVADATLPMSYYPALRAVANSIPRDAIVVNEGANTMDIGRTMLPTYEARQRIDAGTFATMGQGVGYAIAAQIVEPHKKVVAVLGDSAFGFR